MKPKKVLIFGGAGFIGSYVVDELLRKNYSVVVADIHEEKYHHDVTFVKCDITNREEIAKAITQDVDIVYNFAGYANLDRASHDPVPTIELNILGNLYILEEIRKKRNVERYIYASSAYAMNDKGSFYGISKLASEKMVDEYSNKFGIKYTILRYGSVYSERCFDNNYIYSLVRKVVENHKIVHEGDGNEIREYIHAADVAKMAVQVIESDEYEGQYIILTGVERMRRIELFEMIEEILGEKIDVELKNTGYANHYKYSPYALQAKMSRKMVSNSYIDIGQGLLECIKQAKLDMEQENEQ